MVVDENEVKEEIKKENEGWGFWTFRNIIMVALIFSVIMFGFWYYFFGAGLVQSMREENDQSTKLKQVEVMDLEPMIVPLYSPGQANPSFAKIDIAIEAKGTYNIEAVKSNQTRIVDILYQYVRGLRPDDLRGSMGLYRLRKEIALRINTSIAPSEIEAVLFKDLIVQ
jgi:flagellar FliL protein